MFFTARRSVALVNKHKIYILMNERTSAIFLSSIHMFQFLSWWPILVAACNNESFPLHISHNLLRSSQPFYSPRGFSPQVLVRSFHFPCPYLYFINALPSSLSTFLYQVHYSHIVQYLLQVYDKVKEDVKEVRSRRCSDRTTRLDLLSYDGSDAGAGNAGIVGLDDVDRALKDAIVTSFERREQAYAREVRS